MTTVHPTGTAHQASGGIAIAKRGRNSPRPYRKAATAVLPLIIPNAITEALITVRTGPRESITNRSSARAAAAANVNGSDMMPGIRPVASSYAKSPSAVPTLVNRRERLLMKSAETTTGMASEMITARRR